ncbi:MAG: 1-(5-phosphoribosyl)-5-[(5-phosphoribosylamino)methylideneamino]imidazole-4-carboxamide isomerase [Actinobacteria bacterium]|nr:1-(5-phosphoribosyl)-5-[(5-phosphoribosylamino)methylideneamino]imidazole-4-carboxamide isomerase [Actinomycetota bacterium]
MIIYPAIDIIDGECVRLTKGNYELKKKYSPDPEAVAMQWKKCGAEWLHVVDLDGARTGALKNLEIVGKIKKTTGLKVQYGGGIRSIESIDTALNMAIDRVILGTAILKNKDFLGTVCKNYQGRFIISLDFDSTGKIYAHGWQSGTGLNIFKYFKENKIFGTDEFIITNISRDGTLSGTDTKIIEKVLKLSNAKFIVAGGVTDISDIIKLKKLEVQGVSGVIIGKALYEETIDIKDAIAAAKGELP